jgi:hypothetical protein
MRIRGIWTLCALLLAVLGGWQTPHAEARFAFFGEPVPVERLIKNVGAFVEKHPRDARGYYTLGRIHSYAFALGREEMRVLTRDVLKDKPLDLPSFHSILDNIRYPRARPEAPLSPAEREHFLKSVQLYRKATELDPQSGLYWLGLGWMCEQGVRYAREIAAAAGAPSRSHSPAYWRAESLKAYRKAYRLTRDKDRKAESFYHGAPDSISKEAGEGIKRLLSSANLTAEQKREIADIDETLKMIQDKPQWITPIIFPLHGAASLAQLLDPERIVSFDLAGNGGGARWRWVGAQTGILVWDPEQSGRIVSGRQLFGSVTWGMFWRNGYEPLAALDNDRDGWLSGAELAGIAVWNDRNGNAVSDPGEVTPVTESGIARIAARPSAAVDGVPCHAQGIERTDGGFLPTYDWTPRSLPVHPERRKDRSSRFVD